MGEYASSDLHASPFDRFAKHCGKDAWLDEMLERITLH